MKYKYLEKVVKIENTPYGWCPDDSRQKKWKKQREEYGFDERETWDLDYSFFCWLYSRLIMYKKIACIDLSFNKYKIKGKEITQAQCIDIMIKDCEKILRSKVDRYQKERNEVLNIWRICSKDMWW